MLLPYCLTITNMRRVISIETADSEATFFFLLTFLTIRAPLIEL